MLIHIFSEINGKVRYYYHHKIKCVIQNSAILFHYVIVVINFILKYLVKF